MPEKMATPVFNLPHAVAQANADYFKDKPMRPTYGLKGHVDVVLNIAGGEWNGEAEVHYNYVPAFAGKPDEPGYGEHIEIRSVCLLYTRRFGNEIQEKRLDITAIVDDDLHAAIQSQLLGD